MKKILLILSFVACICFASSVGTGIVAGSGSGNVTDINADTTAAQTLTTGTTGTDFAIVDNAAGDHKFNLPDASATARGLVSTGAQTIAGAKTLSSAPILSALTASQAVVTDGSKALASLGYASANTASNLVQRDGSGNFAAGTITAALTGNASTATALAANPTDCGAGEFASAIAASGNLTCSNPFTGLVESYSGHIETAADKTYVIDHYASYAKQITNIRIKCTSGTITAALKIGGTNITTCNGISVSSTSATTTCDTGSTNDLAANGELTLVTSSNSSCTDLVFTIKTTRD